LVGVALDLEGLCFSINTVKGNKRCAAAAVANCEAFKSIIMMVYLAEDFKPATLIRHRPP
jgi:hypothetical protein